MASSIYTETYSFFFLLLSCSSVLCCECSSLFFFLLLLFVAVAFLLLLISSFNLDFTLLFQVFTFYEQVGFNVKDFMKQLLKDVLLQIVPFQRMQPSLTWLYQN